MIRVRLEKHLEHSLCQYPELIDDSLWGIRQGMGVLGPDYPMLKRGDCMPNGRIADMVFVEQSRITVIEIKKDPLRVTADGASREDVVDQIADYLSQCRLKCPNRAEYRGFIVGTGILRPDRLVSKISALKEDITPLVFGRDIPTVIKFCACGRALDYFATLCRCGLKHR